MGKRAPHLLALAMLPMLACSLAFTPLGTGASSSQQTINRVAGQATVRGPRGPRGLRGFRGPRGFRGVRGPQGVAGPQGPQGAEGLEGADGPIGFPGPRGEQGPTGPQGAMGMSVGRPGYTSSKVDALGGYLGTAAIGGLGLIAYTGFSVEALKVAHCSNTACTDAIVSTLGAPDNFAFETTSVAIGSDGLGVIAFIEPKGLIPKLAHCDNLACTSATISSFDPQGDTFRDG